jgi:deazaflavin-dependent oxidoreductase (nitroreductase family)
MTTGWRYRRRWTSYKRRYEYRPACGQVLARRCQPVPSGDTHLRGHERGGGALSADRHYLDQMVNKLTGDRYSFTGIAGGLPALILTTTGAKSGQPRTVAVFGIAHPHGPGLIASNFGCAKHPAWYHNLNANPGPARAGGRSVADSRHSRPVVLCGWRADLFQRGLPTTYTWARSLRLRPVKCLGSRHT